MWLRLFVVFVILLMWILVQEQTREEFGLFRADRTYYYLHPESSIYMNYQGCIGIQSNELAERLNSSPCHYRMFTLSNNTLPQIDELAKNEIQRLGGQGKTVGILIGSQGSRQTVIMFFPDYNREEEYVTSFSMISKLHRWYFLLLYTRYYGANNNCVINEQYTHCPGKPGMIVRRSGNFIIGKTWRIWTVPCGLLNRTQANNFEIKVYKNDAFYAFYTPKWAAPPKLSFMSQYDAMKFGCEMQLVSDNGMWVCYLSPRGLGVYRVNGDVYGACREAKVAAGALKWIIPIKSARYGKFKLEDNKVKLIDWNRAIWVITMDTKKTPIVLKLNNNGYFDFYDSDGNYIDNITSGDINAFLNPELDLTEETRRQRRLRMERELNLLRRNLELDKQRAQAELDDENNRRKQRELDYYNKFVCPIGE